MNGVPTIFDAFNARYLSPVDVAATFVPSESFKLLSEQNHSVLVGPRGSGKTTLLKMLETTALASWKHELAEGYRASIHYTGVFIGTDNSWAGKLDSLGEGRLDNRSHRVMAVAAFTTHVLKAVLRAMRDRLVETEDDLKTSYRGVFLSEDSQARIAESLAQGWRLRPDLYSFRSLNASLSLRLARIRELANRLSFKKEKARNEALANMEYLHLDFLQSTIFGIDIFNDEIGDQEGHWALLFDELELVPAWIQEELVKSLRSRDQKILFKLAMSPHTSQQSLMSDQLSPAIGHDFRQIPLWYAWKEEGYDFCRELWNGMLLRRKLSSVEPEKALGAAYFEAESDEDSSSATAYRSGTKQGEAIKRLAKNDESFRAYLMNKDIDANKLEAVKGSQRSATLRKVGPIIYVREYYSKLDNEQSNEPTKRTRKSAALYAGAASIFAMTEANPRWFIGIIGRMLDKWHSQEHQIPIPIQAKEIENAAYKFAAVISIIPAPPEARNIGRRGLLSLVQKIGKHFHEEIVSGPFKADPYGSFLVDSHTSAEILNLLEKAVNMGAIIYVPDDSSEMILRSLKGKRFRLSYLLAPVMEIPIRLGKPISLNRLLNSVSKGETKTLDLELF